MKILEVVRVVSLKLDMAYERKRRIESALEKCTTRLDIISGGNNFSDRISALIAMKAEIEERIELLTDIKIDCQFDLIRLICKHLKSDAVRSVINRRYGMLENFREIADYMGLSVRQVYRLHKVGINKLMRTI